MTAIAWMLKEWAIAVDALLAGEMILLIRKGGIREKAPSFEIPSDRGLLFPTYEHQYAEALRPPYGARLFSRPVPVVGDEVVIGGWAQITHQLPLSGSSVVESLHPFHIWTDPWLTERLAWKPDRPAYGLLLRAYRFANPIILPYQKQYGGCRSWVKVEPLKPFPQSVPVLPTATYEALTEEIQKSLALIKA